MRGVCLLLRTQPCVNTHTPQTQKKSLDRGVVSQSSDFGPTTSNLMELQEAKTWILGGSLSNKLTQGCAVYTLYKHKHIEKHKSSYK